MRRILLIPLVALLFLFTACGGDDAPQTPTVASGQQQDDDQSAEQAAAPATQQQPDTSEDSRTPGPLKIAFLGDLTGGLAEIGVEMRDGFLLAIKHINAAGGVFRSAG